MTAKRVIEKEGKEDIILLYTDTLIEDDDLYRFMIETIDEMGVEFVKITEGRTPWEVFKDVRWLGNSRVAQCSHLLKQKPAEDWIKKHFQPAECILYMGIDWSEAHRREKVIKNWYPYQVEFPLCDEPYLTKEDMLTELHKINIASPRLYELGFSHNNCSGMCVKGGQAHFINLLKTFPERFEWMENFEKEMQIFLERDDITILKRSRNNKKENLSLETLRKEYQANNVEQLDLFDFGGCGCMMNYDE